jgi:hypothetical protein
LAGVRRPDTDTGAAAPDVWRNQTPLRYITGQDVFLTFPSAKKPSVIARSIQKDCSVDNSTSPHYNSIKIRIETQNIIKERLL